MKKWLIAIFVCLACVDVAAQVPVAPLLQPHQHFVDSVGSPCAGCSLYSYIAGTTTPQPTYTDSTGIPQNTNPIILDTSGAANLWIGTTAYKFILKDTSGSTLWTIDNVPGAFTFPLPIAQGGTGATTAAGAWVNITGGTQFGSGTSQADTFPGSVTAPSISGVLNATQFSGADIGAKVNAAYAALPSTGGEIYVPASSTCYSYTTPIVFATNGKPVTFRGAGQPATCLSYAGTTGVGITLNTGVTENQPRLEDFSLIGAGVGNSTTGILFGGLNSQETASWSRVKVEGFGLGVEYTGGGTFLVSANEVVIKSNGQNFSDLTAQENLTFINSTFALDTPGTDGTTANSVEIQGGGDFHFIACSFDNVQVSVTANATASFFGGHFENPATGSYDYFVMAGNTLNLTNVLFLQDNLSSFPNAQFGSASAGTVNVFGGQFFDPTSTAYFMGISGTPNVNIYGLNPDSATPGFINGTTSGRIVQAPDSAGNFILPDAVVATGNVTAKVNLIALADILGGPAATLNNSMEQSFNSIGSGNAGNCGQWNLFGNANNLTFCGDGLLTIPKLVIGSGTSLTDSSKLMQNCGIATFSASPTSGALSCAWVTTNSACSAAWIGTGVTGGALGYTATAGSVTLTAGTSNSSTAAVSCSVD